jgi:hypothetical protein
MHYHLEGFLSIHINIFGSSVSLQYSESSAEGTHILSMTYI